MQADKHHRAKQPIKEGDLLWVHIRKEKFPHLRKNMLMPRAIGPFPVLQQYGNNAFKIKLPKEYNISSTFNIGDLTLYSPVEELRTVLSQEGGVEINVHVSRESSKVGPREDPNSAQEDQQRLPSNSIPRTDQIEQTDCQVTLYGLNTKGTRAFLVNLRDTEVACETDYKGEQWSRPRNPST